eukprot:TRINITY_DN5369_c0_g1_i1.p1 TRINITY_DN5369_c0_g1~~TRINITY_DN5369_c0_g1_i1.p1  ORF type:complete len:390 (+),score=42.28 TRINITY_DN5369_c0_g1_i1:131-1300(+)
MGSVGAPAGVMSGVWAQMTAPSPALKPDGTPVSAFQQGLMCTPVSANLEPRAVSSAASAAPAGVMSGVWAQMTAPSPALKPDGTPVSAFQQGLRFTPVSCVDDDEDHALGVIVVSQGDTMSCEGVIVLPPGSGEHDDVGVIVVDPEASTLKLQNLPWKRILLGTVLTVVVVALIAYAVLLSSDQSSDQSSDPTAPATNDAPNVKPSTPTTNTHPAGHPGTGPSPSPTFSVTDPHDDGYPGDPGTDDGYPSDTETNSSSTLSSGDTCVVTPGLSVRNKHECSPTGDSHCHVNLAGGIGVLLCDGGYRPASNERVNAGFDELGMTEATSALPSCVRDGTTAVTPGISVRYKHECTPDDTYCHTQRASTCLLYTSDAADEEDSVDLGGRRII